MILNLTQHNVTPDQYFTGVVEPLDKRTVQALLTFEEVPTSVEIRRRATVLAELAERELGLDHQGDVWTGLGRPKVRGHVMIGGAPYLMSALEYELQARGILPLYAFSIRRSVEETSLDGTVRKVNTFQHAGFVSPGVVGVGGTNETNVPIFYLE